MAKLILLSGLPGSGKSTWAIAYCAESPDERIRINYDQLRLEMFGEGWKFNHAEENTMKRRAEDMARDALLKGIEVVIDNTNLTDSAKNRWTEVAKQLNATLLAIHASTGLMVNVEERFFNTPIVECVKRDATRTGIARVGRAVIERMALFNGLIDWADQTVYPRDFIIVDVDGTLADCEWRRQRALLPTKHKALDNTPMGQCSGPEKGPCRMCGAKPKLDWGIFFRNVDQDPPIKPVVELVERLHNGNHGRWPDYDVLIVSGRDTSLGKTTEGWLNTHLPVPVTHLFMRNGGDNSPDYDVKRLILDQLPKDRIKYVIDDRDQVVKMWREQGLTCLQVASGNF